MYVHACLCVLNNVLVGVFFRIAKKDLGGISLNIFHYQKESHAHDFHVMKYNLDI